MLCVNLDKQCQHKVGKPAGFKRRARRCKVGLYIVGCKSELHNAPYRRPKATDADLKAGQDVVRILITPAICRIALQTKEEEESRKELHLTTRSKVPGVRAPFIPSSRADSASKAWQNRRLPPWPLRKQPAGH